MTTVYYPLKIIKEKSKKKFGRSGGKPKFKFFILCPIEGKKVEYNCGYQQCEFWGKTVLGICFCRHKRAREYSNSKEGVELKNRK